MQNKRRQLGILNSKGVQVIKSDYDEARNFSGSFAAVLTKNGWGYIDKKGILIVKSRFTEVRDFHEGLAAVKVQNFSCSVQNNVLTLHLKVLSI